MAYTPKSKRLAKGDALKSSSLNNLSSNKKIDDILALSKGLNLSESDILKLQSDVVSINTSITSLQTSKQDLLVSGVNIKTINGNSLLGSGNLVISVGGSQNLQQVTDIGSLTTNTITVDSASYYSLIEPADVGTENKTTGAYTYIGGDGVVGIKTSGFESTIKSTNITSSGINLEIPNKSPGNYTIATTADIPAVTPAALTKTDDTNVTLTLGGSPSTALLQATSLTMGWTGTLADSRIASATTWNAKQNAITTGTTAQYFRGDLSLATFPTIPTVTPSGLTKVDDTNVTLTLGGTPSTALLQSTSLTLGWTGTLADSRIASASTWNAKQNAITTGTTAQYFRGDLSLATFPTIPTVGTWGALNYPTWSAGTPFVKMTAAGTFSLDTNTYITGNQSITLSGDVGGTGTTSITTTIGTNKVSNSMLTQVATGTIHGRVTAGIGNIETLTGTQATTLIDIFSSTLKGLAPASGGGTTNFLRADGTWTTPGGGGGGTIYKLTSQTLTAASWVLASGYYTYTFSNVNITTNTRVDFTPDNASYIEVTTCGLTTQVTVNTGTCTFYSIFPPQNNITGEITIFPTV